MSITKIASPRYGLHSAARRRDGEADEDRSGHRQRALAAEPSERGRWRLKPFHERENPSGLGYPSSAFLVCQVGNIRLGSARLGWRALIAPSMAMIHICDAMRRFMARTDAIVLGAGIVGTSVALHLAKRGLSVALVDAPGWARRRATATPA